MTDGHVTVSIPDAVEAAANQWREKCPGMCSHECRKFAFSHFQVDENTDEKYYVFACDDQSECGFYHEDGSPDLRDEYCDVENVYDEDGNIVFQS